jgi:hypothetical protein
MCVLACTLSSQVIAPFLAQSVLLALWLHLDEHSLRQRGEEGGGNGGGGGRGSGMNFLLFEVSLEEGCGELMGEWAWRLPD